MTYYQRTALGLSPSEEDLHSRQDLGHDANMAAYHEGASRAGGGNDIPLSNMQHQHQQPTGSGAVPAHHVMHQSQMPAQEQADFQTSSTGGDRGGYRNATVDDADDEDDGEEEHFVNAPSTSAAAMAPGIPAAAAAGNGNGKWSDQYNTLVESSECPAEAWILETACRPG